MNVVLVDLPEDQRGLSDANERLSQVISAINGYNGQGFQWNLTSYSSATKYAQQLRNLGTAGLHWAVYHSGSALTTDDPIVEVQDAGLFVTDTDFRVYHGVNVVLNVDSAGVVVGSGYPTTLGGNLGVTGTITATDDITTGGTLEADDGLDVIAGPGGFGAIISGSVQLNGTVDISSTLDVDGIATFASGFDSLDVSTIVANSASPALIVQNVGAGALLTVQRFNGVSAVTVDAAGLLTAANGVSTTTVSASSTVTGTQLVSTVVTGTAPLTVASQTVVGNLNASFLEGYDSGDFLLTTGGTITGDLEIDNDFRVDGDSVLGNGTTDRVLVRGGANGLQLTYDDNPATGVFTLGATNAADPSMPIKDNSGDRIAEFFNSTATYQFEMNGDQYIAGELVVDGNTTLGNASTDLAIIIGETRFKGGSTAGSFRAIPTNVASPRLDWYDNTAANVISFNNAASTYQLEVYGDHYVSGELVVDGNVQLGNATTDLVDIKGDLIVRDTLTVTGQATFNDPVYIVGDDLILAAAYIDFDLGSTSGASHSSWDGYITVKHDGTTVKIPYLSGAW